MSYEDGNIYSNPEKFGLEIVAALDYYSGYSWSMRVVWREIATGRILTDADSGCSCNSPWEATIDVAELDPLDINAILEEIKYTQQNMTFECSHEEVDSFLDELAKLENVKNAENNPKRRSIRSR